MAIQSAMVHSASPTRNGLITAVETIAVAAVAAALALLAVRLARGIHTPGDIAVMLTMLAAGYFLADAMTGTVHWLDRKSVV